MPKSEARLFPQEILVENLESFWGLQIQSPQITPARRIGPACGELKKMGLQIQSPQTNLH